MPHEHHGGPVGDVQWAGMLDRLRRTDDIEAAVTARIAGWLVSGTERHIVDLGCGAGGMTAALVAAADPGSHVLAIDGEPALLAETARRAAAVRGGSPGGAVVETRRADLAAAIPLDDDSTDLIWASAVVHHLPDQQYAVSELATRLVPGGRLALAEGGLRPRSLPWDLGIGEPGLELRLDLGQERWFAAMRRDLPGAVPMPYGWPAALRQAGLVEVTSRSFLLDLPAPLSDPVADLVLDGLRGFLERDEDPRFLAAADRETLRRLTDTEDAVHVAVRDQLYLLTARTVHVGRRGPA